MYLIYEKETETRARVELMYGVLPPTEFEGKYIEVAEEPIAKKIIGKRPVLYCNPQISEVWFEYVDRNLTPEEENQILKDKVNLMQQAIDDIVMGGM